MATIITSVQRPTTYKANHKTPETKEYNPISFVFVPIPNSQATNEDLAYDLGDKCKKYYSIDRKSFYITLASSGAEGTTLNETFPPSNQEHVLYGAPEKNTNIIYKIKQGTNEAYKCSANGVRSHYFGDAGNLTNKGISAVSMSNLVIHTRDGKELCCINNSYTNDENTVSSINDTGLVRVEVPSDLDIEYIELRANALYLKGIFSNSQDQSLSNLYVCKHGDSSDLRCTYSTNEIGTTDVVDPINSSTTTLKIKMDSKTYTGNFSIDTSIKYFYKAFDSFVRETPSSYDWEELGNNWENTEIKIAKSGNNTYIYSNDGHWHLERTVSLAVDVNGNITDAISNEQFNSTLGVSVDVACNATFAAEPHYIQKKQFSKILHLSDDSNKIGHFSLRDRVFRETSTIDNQNELRLIIISILTDIFGGNYINYDPNTSKFKSIDTNNRFILDTSTTNGAKIIRDVVDLSSLDLNPANNTQELGAGA